MNNASNAINICRKFSAINLESMLQSCWKYFQTIIWYDSMFQHTFNAEISFVSFNPLQLHDTWYHIITIQKYFTIFTHKTNKYPKISKYIRVNISDICSWRHPANETAIFSIHCKESAESAWIALTNTLVLLDSFSFCSWLLRVKHSRWNISSRKIEKNIYWSHWKYFLRKIGCAWWIALHDGVTRAEFRRKVLRKSSES